MHLVGHDDIYIIFANWMPVRASQTIASGSRGPVLARHMAQANKKETEEQAESPDWDGLGECTWSCPSVQRCSEQGTQIKSHRHTWGARRAMSASERAESFWSMPAFEGNEGLQSDWSWFPLQECWFASVVCTLRRCRGG